MTTKMISLDTSTRSTGFAVWSNGRLGRTGFITREKWEEFPKMLTKLWDFLNKERPDIVVTELTVVTRNAQTQRSLTEMLAVCTLWCELNGRTYYEMRPTSWRKIVGEKLDNKAPKKREELKKWSVSLAKDLCGKDVNDDTADAILLGKAYCYMAS